MNKMQWLTSSIKSIALESTELEVGVGLGLGFGVGVGVGVGLGLVRVGDLKFSLYCHALIYCGAKCAVDSARSHYLLDIKPASIH
jgi:ABC-type nitrate/sulfonate/bicarbonate transport system permease component